jgi:hypothetical protein
VCRDGANCFRVKQGACRYFHPKNKIGELGKIVIVYHFPCLDGAFALFVAQLYLKLLMQSVDTFDALKQLLYSNLAPDT